MRYGCVWKFAIFTFSEFVRHTHILDMWYLIFKYRDMCLKMADYTNFGWVGGNPILGHLHINQQ